MWKYGWKVVLVVIFLHLLLYTVLVQESWLEKTMDAERHSNYAYLGDERASMAETRAANAFNAAFVNTGVMANSFRIFIPDDAQRANSKGLEHMGSGMFAWMETRIRATWTLVYQVFLRFSTAILWWPFLLLAVVPFLVDALMQRKVKATTFGLTSPSVQGLAARSIPLIVLSYALLMFSPVVIHPGWIPALIFVTSALMWLSVSQFVKRG